MHDKIKLQSDSIILTVNGVEISKSCDLAQHVNLENGGVARTSQNGLLLHARHREVDAHLSLWAFKRLVQSGLRPQKWAELIMLLQELLPTKSFLQSNTKVSNQDWIAETVEGQKRFEIFAGFVIVLPEFWPLLKSKVRRRRERYLTYQMDNNSQNIIHATPELPKISTLTNASFECHILSVTELTELNETRGKSVQQMDLKTFPLPCPGPFDIEHSQRTSSSVALENWKFLIRRLQEKKKEKQLRNFYWRQSQQVQHISEDRQLVQQAVVAWKENPEVQRRLSVSSTNDDVSVVVNTLEAPNCPNDQKPKVARSPKAHSEVTDTNSSAQRAEVKAKLLRADRRLALLMFFLNLALLGAKIAACILSNSLTIISSAVDSAVDLLSSLVVWLSTRAVRRHDQYKFPRGRSRLEPLTIIAMSIIRGAAGFLIIEQSAVKMLTSFNVTVELSPLIIMGLTVALKLVAAIFCYLRKTPNARLFAMDNRNDCISNGFAIICAFIGNKFWIYADPIGAILVSIYIIVSWYFTGKSHTQVISGRAASPAYLSRILAVVVEHDSRITHVTRLVAYHFSFQFLVEVDVTLEPTLTVPEAADILGTLQAKINQLPYVERCFITLDRQTGGSTNSGHQSQPA